MSKLVCSNCRRHKKRCDGEAPCQRCQAADIGASCSNHDDYRLILRRETTLQAALSTIVEPAIRFMFGTATSARQGHISVNRSMVQLMGAPYNMAMALHRATLGMPYVHVPCPETVIARVYECFVLACLFVDVDGQLSALWWFVRFRMSLTLQLTLRSQIHSS